MELPFYLNLTEPEPTRRRIAARGENRPAPMPQLAAGAAMPGTLHLLDKAADFRSESGAGAYAPVIVLSYQGGAGPVALAVVSTFTPIYDALDDDLPIGWSFTLDLNTEQIVEYIALDGQAKPAVLDISLGGVASGVALLYRAEVTLLPLVYEPGDPSAVSFATAPILRPDITSATIHRTVPTAGRSLPLLYFTLEGGAWQAWTLRTRSGEADDGESYRLPADYNASTNNVIWVKSAIA